MGNNENTFYVNLYSDDYSLTSNEKVFNINFPTHSESSIKEAVFYYICNGISRNNVAIHNFTPPGWWLAGDISAVNCIAAYQPKGAADYAASLSNLANPGTYDATEGGTPDWDAVNGWKFNGTDDYLITTITLADGWTIIFRFSNKVGTAGTLGGSYNYTGSAGGMLIFPHNSSSKVSYYSPANFQVAPYLDSGVLALAGNKAYRNGSYDGTGSGALPAQNNNFWMGANFKSGEEDVNNIEAYMQAVAVYNITITASQISALTTAMNAL